LFDERLVGVERCDIIVDSALIEPRTTRPRCIRFRGPTLSVTVTCSVILESRLVTIHVTDAAGGALNGPYGVTVLVQGQRHTVIPCETDAAGRVRLAVPDRVVSLLLTRGHDVVAQTAWLRV
jgi:hypothetical protein